MAKLVRKVRCPHGTKSNRGRKTHSCDHCIAYASPTRHKTGQTPVKYAASLNVTDFEDELLLYKYEKEFMGLGK